MTEWARMWLRRILLAVGIVVLAYVVIYKPIFKRRQRPAPAAPPAPVASAVQSGPKTTAAAREEEEKKPPPVSVAPKRLERDKATKLLNEARALLAAGDVPAAQKALEDLTKKYSGSRAASEASFELGKLYLEQNRKYDARNAFSDALGGLDEEERAEAVKRLNELNDFLIFSPASTKDSLVHVVKPGDTVVGIARKYSTTVGLIKRINKLPDVNKIRAGQRLKVISGTWEIRIYKSKFKMEVYFNGHFIREYAIGIGQYDKTPEGEFVINVKTEKPTWYSPEGVIPYGDPRNLLGERWLGFKPKPELTGYGIHGTSDKSSIGKKSSNGCVRLLNQNVIELYDMVTDGTRVIIRN